MLLQFNLTDFEIWNNEVRINLNSFELKDFLHFDVRFI